MLKQPRAAILDCPCCSHPLSISEYTCMMCGTRVVGHFKKPDTIFDEMNDQDLDDLRVLITVGARKTLGKRYDRVRILRDRMLAWLSARPNRISVHKYNERGRILAAMKAGEIDPMEARKKLRMLASEEADD